MASLPALHTHPPHTASALTALQCPSASALAMSAADSKPTATLGHPFSPPAPAAVLSGRKPRTTESCVSSQALRVLDTLSGQAAELPGSMMRAACVTAG